MVETAAKTSFEKLGKDADPKASFTEFYNEWIKINEGQFSDLFASDEFSKVKADVTGLGMDVKKHFEKQFESTFSTYPFVFKSELEELHKTIYDLKKTIKDLQGKSSLNGNSQHESEEEKLNKTAKKK